MRLRLQDYVLEDASRIITPALVIYPEYVESNIKATLKMLRDDPDRWRPHIKTAKLGATIRQLIKHRLACLTPGSTKSVHTPNLAGNGCL
jgi:D-serine deaminase-like pyridoxal phosphate-dependent protein